jgi:hypothetical protein
MPRSSRWLRSNQGVATLLSAATVALLIYLWQQEWTHQELRDGFLLGFFSLLGAATCLLCSLVMVVDSLRHHVEEDMNTVAGVDWLIAVISLLLLYVFYQAAWTIGFVVVAPVFLTVAAFAFGARPWWTAVVSGVLTTVGIAVAFWSIGIDLPQPFFIA